MNDCVLGLASVSSAEASLLVGRLGKRKESTLGMMGRGKREALSIFPLLLFLLGYPAERPRFEKGLGQLGSWRGEGECRSYY